MRVVITGATGNIGTSLVEALLADERIEAIVGIARRVPSIRPPRTHWVALDVGRDDLAPVIHGADAVIHLAWTISPSHDARAMWRTNVLGSRRVAEAAAEAGVPVLVHGSSVGVYAPGPKDHGVDEGWARTGTPTSLYARHKAEAERRLDQIERAAPALRVVRMRPGLCFKGTAASGVRRLFVGPLPPRFLMRPSRIPVVPDIPGLRFQAVHTDDVAEAYRLALASEVRGPINVAADPVLDAATLADALGARPVRVRPGVARAVLEATWRLRLQPTSPGWLDMALAVPVMDTTRARGALGWAPRHSSVDALRELLEGMADRAGAATPPLAPGALP